MSILTANKGWTWEKRRKVAYLLVKKAKTLIGKDELKLSEVLSFIDVLLNSHTTEQHLDKITADLEKWIAGVSDDIDAGKVILFVGDMSHRIHLPDINSPRILTNDQKVGAAILKESTERRGVMPSDIVVKKKTSPTINIAALIPREGINVFGENGYHPSKGRREKRDICKSKISPKYANRLGRGR